MTTDREAPNKPDTFVVQLNVSKEGIVPIAESSLPIEEQRSLNREQSQINIRAAIEAFKNQLDAIDPEGITTWTQDPATGETVTPFFGIHTTPQLAEVIKGLSSVSKLDVNAPAVRLLGDQPTNVTFPANSDELIEAMVSYKPENLRSMGIEAKLLLALENPAADEFQFCEDLKSFGIATIRSTPEIINRIRELDFVERVAAGTSQAPSPRIAL